MSTSTIVYVVLMGVFLVLYLARRRSRMKKSDD
jgi:ABC-type molybdate transport system permease subunit